MWLLGVVRRYIVYRYPHNIYYFSQLHLYLLFFWQQHFNFLVHFKMFFVLVYVIFVQYSKRCSKNIRDRSKIEITRIIINKYVDKNGKRTSIARACACVRVPRLPRARYRVTYISRKLQLTLCNGVVEVS